MGFEVQVQDLRDSADAAREAAAVVRGTDAPEALRGARAGMPGADAVPLVEAVADSWEDAVQEWVRSARRYARGLDTAADRYEADDAAARQAFTGGPGGPHRPR
ncbi:hypothetical protein [uncultured Phycicoccus sp.]|uniref:hypothetical protein n=1 Tax=uncultured Phycicoccus sp. TaxID=661422 RepID=UPI002639C84F|nr:hypothetical protein [uncultured Phycicoccus sp.]